MKIFRIVLLLGGVAMFGLTGCIIRDEHHPDDGNYRSYDHGNDYHHDQDYDHDHDGD